MIYQTEETRERILSVAMEMFIDRGLFDVQMTDIAERAGLSRNTLYRYYRDKSDIALSIVVILLERIFIVHARQSHEIASRSSRSGWECLRRCFDDVWLTDLFVREFRFLAEFDSYYSGSRLTDEVLEKMRSQISARTTELWERVIEQGQRDGSIRSDKDPHLLMTILTNGVRGLHQRVLLRGQSLVETSDAELTQLVREFMDVLFDGIKSRVSAPL
jgi:AcrR family transcriptional regulator